jgi:hypothetical protein
MRRRCSRLSGLSGLNPREEEQGGYIEAVFLLRAQALGVFSKQNTHGFLATEAKCSAILCHRKITR